MKKRWELRKGITNSLNAIEILVNGIPLVGGFANGFMHIVNDNLTEKRLEYFISKLNNLEICIDDINDEASYNTISNTIKIFNCVSRTRRQEKIDLFANLFINGITNKEIQKDGDTFEEKMNLLELLSLEDIMILEALREAFIPLPKDIGNHPVEFVNSISEPIKIVANKLNQNENIILGKLDKLTGYGVCSKRTYQQFTFGFSEVHAGYFVSDLYEELRKDIINSYN